jgi:AmiR/NasT family two-component response regulator
MITMNFSGLRALVVHRADHHRDALTSQLNRIGLHVDCVMPDASLNGHVDCTHVVFFDADTGHNNLFPWRCDMPPMPLVAILSSEAPGRLEWALAQAATGFMIKPIGASGAYQALLVATQLHRQFCEMRLSVASLSERLRARPLVVRAIIEVMRRHELDESQAYERLRLGAMASRQSIEELATSIVAMPTLAMRLTSDRSDLAPQSRASRTNRRNS